MGLLQDRSVYDLERDKPIRPERPPASAPKSTGSVLPVMMVLAPLFLLVMGVVAFTGLAGLLILAAIACVPAFMMLHYMLWGYWLGKSIRDEAESDESEPS